MIYKGKGAPLINSALAKTQLNCLMQYLNDSVGKQITFVNCVAAGRLKLGRAKAACTAVGSDYIGSATLQVVNEMQFGLRCSSPLSIKMVNSTVVLCQHEHYDSSFPPVQIKCSDNHGRLRFENGKLILDEPFPIMDVYTIKCAPTGWKQDIFLYGRFL